MSHFEHLVIDTDQSFEINATSRKIRPLSAAKKTIMQYDHNSEIFTFVMPKEVEGHDMSECTHIEVHFIDKKSNKGLYPVNDLTVDSEDETKVKFTWLISKDATKSVGALAFLVRFACIDNDGTVLYDWHTDIFTGIYVSKGIDNTGAIVEQYSDVLEKWKIELNETASKLPIIGENGNWYLWNIESKSYIDSGKTSKGEDGKTPVVGVDYYTDAEKQAITDYINGEIDGKEDISNKSDTVWNNDGDNAYPTTSAIVDDVYTPHETRISAIESEFYRKEDNRYKVTSFQAIPDDIHYPSEKLVKDSLDAMDFVVNVVLNGTLVSADKNVFDIDEAIGKGSYISCVDNNGIYYRLLKRTSDISYSHIIEFISETVINTEDNSVGFRVLRADAFRPPFTDYGWSTNFITISGGNEYIANKVGDLWAYVDDENAYPNAPATAFALMEIAMAKEDVSHKVDNFSSESFDNPDAYPSLTAVMSDVYVPLENRITNLEAEMPLLESDIALKEIAANKVDIIDEVAPPEVKADAYPNMEATINFVNSKIGWELIDNGTLTYDIQNFSPALDGAYKKLFLSIFVPTMNPDKTTPFPKGRIQLKVQNNVMIFDDGSYNYYNDINGYSTLITFQVEIINDRAITTRKSLPAFNSDDSPYSRYIIDNNSLIHSTIGAKVTEGYINSLNATMLFAAGTSRYFPAGTKYEVWGVKA